MAKNLTMRTYQTHEIKNIALLGNDGSGKTTLTESLLYEAGIIKRRGRITQHNTVSDYFPVEQEYGYSVFSTVFHVEWNGKKLNIIDCPGSDDFVGSALTALNVTDTCVLLLKGSSGVEVGTQNHFRYAEKLAKPVIFLVNQLDDENLDYDHLVAQLREIYGSKVVPVQYPVKTGPDFNCLIDVLLMKKYSWGPEGGAPTIEEIPEEEKEKAMEMHKALVEAAAENDESLMEKFFESESLTEDEMREGIRKGLASRGMFPVFCVCAVKDMGVRRLMEFLGNVVPFVDEMPKVHNTRGEEVVPSSDGPTSLYFFKTAVEPHIGEVQYFKVMSGKVKEGDDLQNADRGSRERIGGLFCCAGATRIKVEELVAGDIGCTVKLKDVKTGNTLNDKNSDNRFNFIKFPNAKYSRAIRAVNESETEKMMNALQKMREEDPTWQVEQSKELRQIIVHGQGEFHLRTLKWRMENNEKIQIVFDEPKIPYRETITKADAVKNTIYSATIENIDLEGKYQIVFTNLCPTGKSSGNADRYAIGNLCWKKYGEPVYETVRSGLEINRYYTVCLPKKVTAIKGASFWTLNNKSQDGTTAYLEEETNNLPFAAGKPFIIQATAEKLEVVYEGAATEDAGTNGALHGTLVYMDAAALAAAGSDVYMLFSNELRPVGENNHLDANRAYVLLSELNAVAEAPQSAPGKRVRAMPMQPQVATGFEAAEANEAPRKVLINGELFILRGAKMYDAKGQLVK